MKKLPIYFLFLFLIIPLAISYPHIGGDDYDFLGGDSDFDEEANVTVLPQSPLNALVRPVLIRDIDNDGVEEVVAMTATGFEIYTLPALAFEGSFIHNDTFTTTAQDFDMIDIDDDNIIEIIATYTKQGDDIVTIIYSWNGTAVNHEATMLPSPGVNVRVSAIGCDDTNNNCLVLFWENDGTNCQLIAMGLNGSQHSGDTDSDGIQGISIFSNFIASECGCVNDMKHITVSDYDGDTFNEYLFSWLQIRDGTTEIAHVSAIRSFESSSSASTNLSLERTYSKTTGAAVDSDACEENLISPALVMSVDQINENQKEVVMAYPHTTGASAATIDVDGGQEEDYGFRMIVWNDAGTELDTHPELFSFDGKKVGNLFVWNGFSGLDKDYCMPVYADNSETLRILCGSRFLSGFFGLNQDEYLELAYPEKFNSTRFLLSHANQITATARYEFINAYGSFDIDFDNELLTQLYAVAPQDQEIISFDYDSSDFDMLFGYDGATMRFFTSEPPQFGCLDQLNCYSSITINPSTEQCWQTNTTVEIRVTVDDVDSDDVNVNVVIYLNDSNSQETGWSNNISNGGTVTFVVNNEGDTLIANKSGNNYRLLVQLREQDKLTQVETFERFFTVGDTGCIEKGDVIETINGEDGIEDLNLTFSPETLNQNDNAIVNSANTIGGMLGFDASIIWILFAVAVAGTTLYSGIRTGKLEIGVFGGLAAFFIISLVGVIFGLMSVVYLIIPVVVSLGGVALFLKSKVGGVG